MVALLLALPVFAQDFAAQRAELVGPTIGENHPKTGNVHYLPPGDLARCVAGLEAAARTDRSVEPRDFDEWMQGIFGEGDQAIALVQQFHDMFFQQRTHG